MLNESLVRSFSFFISWIKRFLIPFIVGLEENL